MQQESSLGDTVGLVVETLREHLIEVLQLLILQDLGMQSCNTVDGIAGNDSHMGHLHLSIVQNRHLANLLLHIHAPLICISCLDLCNEAAVDLFHDLVNSGKQSGEKVDGPFFQSFRHDGMVGIGTGSGGDVPCFIPAETVIIKQDSHQFRYSHGRVGIVELEGNLLI